MKIFIGKIPSELRSDDVRDFFETFGEIVDFNFKGSYAFVEYRDESVANRVLENRDYRIGDFSVFVEESIGRKRSRYDLGGDDYSRRPAYDQHSYDRPSYDQPQYVRSGYGRPSYDQSQYDSYRRDSYNDRAPQQYQDDRRGYDSYGRGKPIDPRDDCPHCSRCEIHSSRRGGYGEFDRPKRPKRDHPNDVNKLVIENLPMNAMINDVEDFVRKEGYDVVFARLTARGDSAIVELRDISSKEDALTRLAGKELNGTMISVRNFKTGAFPSGQDRRDDSHGGVDLYGGIDNVNVD